jgi:protein-S-isoprenylcysteine O-methyltransferase Ste14
MDGSVVEARKDGWLQTILRPAVLDRIEQAAVLVLYALLIRRVLMSDNALAPVLMLSEGAIVLFVLIRRPTNAISIKPGDWLLASIATAAPLLISPVDASPAALVAPATAFVLLGNCMQIWSKLVLRRSFGIAPANRGVKFSGPYRLVRHPMYAGYLTANIGLFMLMPSLANLAIYVVCWSAQILRLLAEERLLSEDAAYRTLKETTRFRLIPGIF